jgi:hypothetical protein
LTRLRRLSLAGTGGRTLRRALRRSLRTSHKED